MPTLVSEACRQFNPGTMVKKLEGQGLALSGGGYRASLFHLGVTRRLHEIGALQRTTRLSSVSGGSILAGFLAHRMLDRGAQRLEFDDWETEVSAPFRDFVREDIRTGLFIRHIAWNWAFPGARARGLEKAFRKRLGAAKLVELPKASADSIEFIFLATDIEHGVLWRYTSDRIGTYKRPKVDTPDSMTIAHAVAASACFPPIFGPIKVKVEGKVIAHLTDGGVYDNTGMQPIWVDNKVVLVSDAGTPFETKVPKWFGSRIMRYVDIGRNQVGALRRNAIIRRLDRNYQNIHVPSGEPTDKPSGAFWRLASKHKGFLEGADDEFKAEYATLKADWYGYPESVLDDRISEIRTDMDAFTNAESKILENHGYTIADLALRRHARHLGNIGARFEVPHRDMLDPGTVSRKLRNSHSRLHFWQRWFD